MRSFACRWWHSCLHSRTSIHWLVATFIYVCISMTCDDLESVRLATTTTLIHTSVHILAEPLDRCSDLGQGRRKLFGISPRQRNKAEGFPAIMAERLAEYGWKPHRDLLAQNSLSQASIYWYMREQKWGTGFIEFEISNSTISTVFLQPLNDRVSVCVTRTWANAMHVAFH